MKKVISYLNITLQYKTGFNKWSMVYKTDKQFVKINISFSKDIKKPPLVFSSEPVIELKGKLETKSERILVLLSLALRGSLRLRAGDTVRPKCRAPSQGSGVSGDAGDGSTMYFKWSECK